MHKCLSMIIFSLIFYSGGLFAQASSLPNVIPSGNHKYYISINGIKSKADIANVETIINKKTGVKFFGAKKLPPIYFLLVSDDPISRQQFVSWLNGSLYTAELFEEGTAHLEKVMVSSQKNNKKNFN